MSIRDKRDLNYYLEADRLSLGKARRRPRIVGDEIWRFQRALRRYEYSIARSPSLLRTPARLIAGARWYLWSLVLGVTIHPNVFGPGLSIAHRGNIVVNAAARVGRDCRVHIGVNIGTAAGEDSAAPTLGDGIYLAPGAKLFGPIEIAHGVAIGANAVVSRSVGTPNVSIGGVPSRIISQKGSSGLLIRGANLALENLTDIDRVAIEQRHFSSIPE